MQRFIRILIVIFVLTLVWPSFGTSGPMERSGDFSYLERLTSLPSDSIPTSLLPSTTQLEKISPLVLEATDDGVQTDFLVVLTEQADLIPSYDLPTKKMRGRWVYETLWETAQHSQAPLRAWLGAKRVPYRSFYIVNLIYVQAGDRALVEELAARSDVVRIEANPRIQNVEPWTMSYSASMSPQAIEWNITQVGAPEVWAMGYTGHGVVVGGQGTGYDWDHPALRNQYRGWNGSIADHNYNWHDAVHSGGGVCGPDSPEPCDDQGLGTHTMGTAVGDDGGSNQIGLAPGARWIGCRNMNQGVGTPTTYLECFEFFLAPYPVGGTPDDGDPDMAPDVTNNSWSCPPSEGCSWATLQAAVEAHRAAGIMTVVEAGNSGSACSTVDDPPGIYDASYSVGATDNSDYIASFSSRGPVTVDGSNRLKPDISAPGVDIRSSVLGGGYGWKNGTSMASPHVAGAVALIWSAQPALRNHIVQTEEIINTTAVPRYSTQCGDPPDTVPNNVYGWGRLDVLEAVNWLINRECTSDVDCDDQNPCTTDTCVDGCCEHIPLADGTSCNDKKFCTKTDTCQDGVCVGSGNPCPPNCFCDENNDTCDCPETETICDDGIDNDNDGSTDCLDSDCEGLACNDGDPCTEDDTCSGGRCVGISIDCDDGNDCSDDSCEAGQCVYECNATSFVDSCCDDPVCADALVCKPITPPEITSSPVTTATVNILYSYDVECNPSEDIYNMVFSLNTSPSRMNLDEETGLITWTPTIFQLGNHDVEVQVEDEYEGKDTQEFTIHVNLFPWCPMSLALYENEDDLSTLRKFRDERLSSTPLGQDCINFFYKHSDEVTLILLLNPDLISHTAEAIGKLLPVVDPLIKGESIYIDMETIEEIDSLLDGIEAKASPSLKTAILKIKKDVSRGEIFEQLRIIISE